jgi:acyl-CoA thioester hydrolase
MADGMILDRPPEGRLDGAGHRFPIRVYYEDTDAGGIVYHAAYLRFAERARTEMMRLAGIEHDTLLAEHGVMLAVHRCSLEFHRPARLDDALVVASRIAAASGATITIEQQVLRAPDARPDGRSGAEPDAQPGAANRDGFLNLVSLTLRLVTLDRQLRPTRLPSALRTVLSKYL